MSNIATRGAAATAIASLGNLKTGLQNVASTIVTAGGTPILRLLRDGSWRYGAENIDVEQGSLWAVNIQSLMHGWVAWTDRPGNQKNEIVGEVMVPMTSALPPYTELNDVKELQAAWAQQLSVEMVCVNGTDKGETVVYKVTSVGGMNALKGLIAKIVNQLDTDPDNPIPLVALETDSYNHTKWGKTFTPVISIVEWVPLTDSMPEVDEPATAAPAPKAEPVRRRGASVPSTKAEAKPAKAETKVTDADRRAALLAELEALQQAEAEEEAVDAEPEQEAPAEEAPRRRRRA